MKTRGSVINRLTGSDGLAMSPTQVLGAQGPVAGYSDYDRHTPLACGSDDAPRP